MALVDDPRDFDKWFNDFTLDGIVAVSENLAMIDKVTSGMVRVGPGQELCTEDYIEFSVAFGKDCDNVYVEPEEKHCGLRKAIWVSWDEKFTPDPSGGTDHTHRRWTCPGNDLPLQFEFNYKSSGRNSPKVAITMFFLPRERAAHMASMDEDVHTVKVSPNS